MTGFIVSVFPFRNRVSSKEAFEGLELGERKLSRPVLRGPGGRKVAWLLGNYRAGSLFSRDRNLVFHAGSYSTLVKPGSSLFYMLVEKLKHLVFPRRDVRIEHAVPVILRQTNRRVNLQNVGLVQAFEFRG